MHLLSKIVWLWRWSARFSVIEQPSHCKMATAFAMLGRCFTSAHVACHKSLPALKTPILKAPRIITTCKPHGAKFITRCELSELAESRVEADEEAAQILGVTPATEDSPPPERKKSPERSPNFFPKKGQDLEMVCESLAYKGLGVCKIVESGFVVFCERALPGERLVARIIKKRKGFAEVQIHFSLQFQSGHL